MLNKEILRKLNEYIEENYQEIISCNAPVFSFENIEPSFSKKLLDKIDEKELTDVAVYKNARVSKAVFSNIRSKSDYNPSKQTAIALCIGCKLNFEDTEKLLKAAGYSLSRSNKEDIIVEYFIKNGIFDINKINDYLFEYDLPLFPVN